MMDMPVTIICCILCVVSMSLAGLPYCRNGNTANLCSLNAKLSFEEAQKKCTYVGNQWTLLHIPKFQNPTAIIKQIEDRSVWYDLQRIVGDQWTTVSGEPVAENIEINGVKSPRRCTAIEMQNGGALEAASCYHLIITKGYVCEFKKICPWSLGELCLRMTSERALYFGYNKSVDNRFKARALCMELGGDLAVPKSKSELKRIAEYIKEHKLKLINGKRGKSPGSFFVGITKERWVSNGMSKEDILMKISFDFWTPGHPADVGNCVILTKDGWNTTACTSRHVTVCQLKADLAARTEKVMPWRQADAWSVHESSNVNGNRISVLIILVSLVLMLLVLLFVAVLGIYKKMYRDFGTRSAEKGKENETDKLLNEVKSKEETKPEHTTTCI